MKFRFVISIVVAVFSTLVAPVSPAHHSLAGQFDVQKPFVVKGVITYVEWVNPHIYVLLDAKDAKGEVVTWRLESVPVARARKAGITKAMLEGNGETVTVDGFPARDGTPNLGYMFKLVYPDGRSYELTADPRLAAPAAPAR